MSTDITPQIKAFKHWLNAGKTDTEIFSIRIKKIAKNGKFETRFNKSKLGCLVAVLSTNSLLKTATIEAMTQILKQMNEEERDCLYDSLESQCKKPLPQVDDVNNFSFDDNIYVFNDFLELD